jgi:hypothetical protein
MRTRKASAVVLALGALALLTQCGPADPSGSPAAAPSALRLPADVARVLGENCTSCHAATPRFGAPMSLVTYADTQRAAVTTPTQRVWQLLGARTHDARRPMPPSGLLGAADLGVLDRWVAAGAPPCAGSTCEGTPVTPDPGPVVRPLPCQATNRFVAHGATAGSEFHVPTNAGNLTKCFAFRSPFTEPTQATAFGPIIDDARVLHHLILFSTDTPQRDGDVFDCDGRLPRDARFVTGWAPGGQNGVLPPDVGMEMPTRDGWFILQIHYWNVAGITDADDASGIQLCATTELRPHAAAISTLGSLDIDIPPRVTDHAVTGRCTPTAREPIHIIASGPHMHRLGTSLRTELLRGGDANRMEMVVNVENFSFDAQTSYPAELVVMPGDVLRTTCRYRNTTTSRVFFGERTEDEMCFNFVLAWPAGALSNTAGSAGRRCIDRSQ